MLRFVSFQCLIAANLLCKRLYEEGDFGFYSGAFTQNANDELLFYNRGVPVEINGEIHSTVRLINGYLHINQLGENDVGIVYTDCEANTLHELRKWIDGWSIGTIYIIVYSKENFSSAKMMKKTTNNDTNLMLSIMK